MSGDASEQLEAQVSDCTPDSKEITPDQVVAAMDQVEVAIRSIEGSMPKPMAILLVKFCKLVASVRYVAKLWAESVGHSRLVFPNGGAVMDGADTADEKRTDKVGV